jgi:hypothetical protein
MGKSVVSSLDTLILTPLVNGNVKLAEPFDDLAFVSRLQKLVSMLGSEQPGEAEAARRKLLDHLGSHRLSLTDIAMRLRDGAGKTASNNVSFTQGAREMSLERQLSIARISKQEMEADLRRSEYQRSEMQHALQQAAFDVGRALRGQARARLIAAIGWMAAAIAGGLLLVLTARSPATWLFHGHPGPRPVAAGQVDVPEETDIVMRLAPGEHYGTVLVQDLAVRLTPSDDAGIRAFLNRGMRVVIEQQVRSGVQNWLLIRSVTGSGWVRGGDVLH